MAEDDDDDFELFSEVIRDLSLKIFLARARNGEVLMKILHEDVPDMLFLDILMPCKMARTAFMRFVHIRSSITFLL